MPNFSITTLGCKVNQYESEAIARRLEAEGWRRVSNGRTCDLCIVNTCTVTGRASMQSRQAVRRAVRAGAGARVLATGCYAQSSPEELADIGGVMAVVGQGEKTRIPDLVAKWWRTGDAPGTVWREIARDRRFQDMNCTVAGYRSRPFLKIQDGCNAFCTYCIVPYTRGRSRSMPPGTVLERLETLGTAGYGEVVLTGIHLGCYGLDLSAGRTGLLGLLKRIRRHPPGPRIRISSIEPQELSPEIIRLVSSDPIFCHHFHIPLQSGDDSVLTRMHRPYDADTFARRVEAIHRLSPRAAVGVDVLVGFPGETAAAFENTFRLLQSLPVAYLHVFPFSPRPGTPAARFSDPVPAPEIRTRSARMRELGRRKRRVFNADQVGRTLEVLIEGRGDDPSAGRSGLSANYVRVRIVDPPPGLENRIVPVRIVSADDDGRVLGTPIVQ